MTCVDAFSEVSPESGQADGETAESSPRNKQCTQDIFNGEVSCCQMPMHA